MKYIGKYGEHLVLSELLKRDIEAYLAIKSNQDDYDITAIIDNNIVRIQVKTTELENQSTNNSIGNLNKNYNFLVLVVISKSSTQMFILSKEEVLLEKGDNKDLSVTQNKGGKPSIKENIQQYENLWEKITTGEIQSKNSTKKKPQ